MGKRTAFYDLHIKQNAKMVDFGGWDMPLHYGSQIKEHHQVRASVGVFDVSHMGIIDLKGENVIHFLSILLANDVNRLSDGKALYSCMLNNGGGIIDDLIVYRINEHFFRIIVNAATYETDLAWILSLSSKYEMSVLERKDLAMLAIQGPNALTVMLKLLDQKHVDEIQKLPPFHAIVQEDLFIARTGYTGENGFEIIFPRTKAQHYWDKLLSLHVVPCGLGARDTLRLEAGLNLYGTDMTELNTPLESNLAWTVAFEPNNRTFVGREALEKQLTSGIKFRLVGLVLKGSGIMRNHQKIFAEDSEIGTITSGGYSPTLEKSIALARISSAIPYGSVCYVSIRDKLVPAEIVKPPFIKKDTLKKVNIPLSINNTGNL